MKTFTRKAFGIACSLVLMTGLAACGGSGGGGGDDTADDATFTSTDAQFVGAGLYNSQNAAYNDINSQYRAAADLSKAIAEMAVDAAKASRSGNIVVNTTDNCRVAGHTTLTGNFPWQVNYSVPPDDNTPFSFTINGQLKQDVSDPTNNLNDCEVGNGIILDGTLYSDLTMSGDDTGSGSAQWSTDGILGINRRGSAGGLVMIADDCRIFFTIHFTWTASSSTGSASGTICGESYSFSF